MIQTRQGTLQRLKKVAFLAVSTLSLLGTGCADTTPDPTSKTEEVEPDYKTAIAVYGEAVVAIKKVEHFGKLREYDKIYDLLAKEYKEDYDRDIFTDRIVSLEWEPDEIIVMSAFEHEGITSFVVRTKGTIKSGSGRSMLGMTSPVYVKLEGNEWKLLNFPFLANRVRIYPNHEISLSPKK